MESQEFKKDILVLSAQRYFGSTFAFRQEYETGVPGNLELKNGTINFSFKKDPDNFPELKGKAPLVVLVRNIFEVSKVDKKFPWKRIGKLYLAMVVFTEIIALLFLKEGFAEYIKAFLVFLAYPIIFVVPIGLIYALIWFLEKRFKWIRIDYKDSSSSKNKMLVIKPMKSRSHQALRILCVKILH